MEYRIVRRSDDELMHHGVKGMKWGVHKKLKDRQQKIRRRRLDRETLDLVGDSKTVTAKAEPGKTRVVPGRYSQKRNGYTYSSYHLVDDFGKVKLSYINGVEGHHFVTAGKDYIDKLDLSRHFRSIDGTYDYDVYK